MVGDIELGEALGECVGDVVLGLEELGDRELGDIVLGDTVAGLWVVGDTLGFDVGVEVKGLGVVGEVVMRVLGELLEGCVVWG